MEKILKETAKLSALDKRLARAKLVKISRLLVDLELIFEGTKLTDQLLKPCSTSPTLYDHFTEIKNLFE